MNSLRLLVISTLIFFIAGCNSYRFVPSHGGGKRFDEEERAVSAAIRNAVAQLDVGLLSGHKVNIAVTTLANNGGASITFPGFNGASVGYSYNRPDYTILSPYYSTLNYQNNLSASINYNPSLNAVPTVFGTDQDVSYLEAALQMKLRVSGASVAVSDPEYMLYVLVDVLGTNRSRQENLIAWRDILTASCELTYYIVETKTNKIAAGAKRAGAEASYSEESILGSAGYKGEREQCRITPNPMPTDVNDPVILFNRTVVFHGGTQQSEPTQKTVTMVNPTPEPNIAPIPSPPPPPVSLPGSVQAPKPLAVPEPNNVPAFRSSTRAKLGA